MSSSSIGYRAEKDAREDLEKENYQTFSPPRRSFRYGKQDIFIFDILAINKHLGTVRFIQVKKGRTQGFLKVLAQWSREYQRCECSFELWVRLDVVKHKKRWRKYIFRYGKEITD